jgi:drug/metabolite transporter (DMT)-like permease
VVSVLFALLTALFNGLASVLQRMAAATAPAATALHLSLFRYLVRHKVWLFGIGMVVVAAVCQAIALATGPVALVQPIFIIELPFTLLVASRLAHRRLPRRTWWAVVLVTVALGGGLAAAAPSGGGTDASLRVWVTALIVTACFETVVIIIGVRTRGNARGAAFGLAAACGYALTATLLKSAVANLDQGIGPFFSSWQLYGTAVAGVGALFLLQNGLQAGSLVAVQPPLTLGDALISAAYGVTVLGEEVNTGGWLLVIEIVAVLAIAVGCIELSRSLAMVHQVKPAELACATGGSHPVRPAHGGRPGSAASGCRPARPGRAPVCGRTRRCPSGSGHSRVRRAPAARRCRRGSRTRCR